MPIDFLTPEDGDTINTQTQVQDPLGEPIIDLLKEPVIEKIKEPTIDLLAIDEDDITPTVTNNNFDYTDILQKLMEKGTIVDLPETFNNDAERGPVTSEELEEVIAFNNDIKEQAVTNSTISSVLGKMSPELQRAYEYEISGGKPSDYLKIIIETQDLKDLDITNELDQEKIVREFYKNTGLDPDEIKEKITDLKDASLLEKEATKLKPKLDKRAEDIASDKLESQKIISAQKRSLTQAAANRVTEKLVKGFEGIKFNANEANEVLNNLMVEQDFTYGENNTQTKTTIEYLIDYHKYSQQGDPSRVIKALMILDPNGKYDDKFNKIIKDQAVEKFANDHIKDNKNKFNVKSPVSTAPTALKAAKFEFKK